MLYILAGSGFLLLILALEIILGRLIRRKVIKIGVGYFILYAVLFASVLQYLVPVTHQGLRDLQTVIGFLALLLLLGQAKDWIWGFYKDSGSDDKGK